MAEGAAPAPRRLRVALVGCGGFGVWVTKYILEHADICAFCDASLEAAEGARKMLGSSAPVYTEFRVLAAADLADAVFIATPNDSHCELAVAAAGAGLHIFCEKAMARTTAECWQMAQAAGQAGVRLVVGHKRRLRRSYARMLELTRSEELLGCAVSASVTQYTDGHSSFPAGSWCAQQAAAVTSAAAPQQQQQQQQQQHCRESHSPWACLGWATRGTQVLRQHCRRRTLSSDGSTRPRLVPRSDGRRQPRYRALGAP